MDKEKLEKQPGENPIDYYERTAVEAVNLMSPAEIERQKVNIDRGNSIETPQSVLQFGEAIDSLKLRGATQAAFIEETTGYKATEEELNRLTNTAKLVEKRILERYEELLNNNEIGPNTNPN